MRPNKKIETKPAPVIRSKVTILDTTVYDRVVRLATSNDMGEHLNIVSAAIYNLHTVDDIRKFVAVYERRYPDVWKRNIAYALGFFTPVERQLWHSAVGDRVGISQLYNRSERELYTKFTFIDDKGKVLDEENNYTNPEKGNHQSK